MLEPIWKKIVRRKPYTLWDLPAFILWLVSFPYRWVVLYRRANSQASVRLKVPVISVGSVAVGGSGKTPLVAFLAHDLLEQGIKVGIVSSGYRRSGTGSFVKSGHELRQLDVAETGDEVMLLSQLLPEAIFAVHKVKSEAARLLAQDSEVEVVIVDDGFQHYRLHRDLELVTYDAALKKRHLRMFPYGMLREPLSALSQADILVITRAKHAVDIGGIKKRLQKVNSTANIYQAGFSAHNLIGRDRQLPIKYLEDKSVYLFAGVGNFRALKRQVAALSGDLDFAREFSDHQIYSKEALEQIRDEVDRFDSDLILTTFKDWVKLGDFDFDREIYYLDVTVDLDPGEEKLIADIIDRLKLPVGTV